MWQVKLPKAKIKKLLLLARQGQLFFFTMQRLRAKLSGLHFFYLPRRVYSYVKQSLRAKLSGFWFSYLPRLRPLLHKKYIELSFIDAIRKLFVGIAVSFPDFYYRLLFKKLDKLIDDPSCDTGFDNPGGFLFSIGTLGPGGAERQFVKTIGGLIEKKVGSVTAVCYHLDTPLNRFFLSDLLERGATVLELNQHASQLEERFDRTSKSINKLFRGSIFETSAYIHQLAQLKPKTAHFWLDQVNIAGGIAAVAVGVKNIVLSTRSLPPYNFVFHHPCMREAYKWLARQPGVTIINNSKAGACEYENWLNLDAGSIPVIHNGFDYSPEYLDYCRKSRGGVRKNYNLEEAIVIGTVMRFTEEKRPLLWLAVAAILHKRDSRIRFLIVGDGPLKTSLEHYVRVNDLSNVVNFTGHQKEALKQISAMDIFLLTSRIEGLPNVLVESQLLGVPVVSSNAGGASETFIHGLTGWLIESDDPEEIADVLKGLIGNQQWMEKARAAMPNFLNESFSVDKMLEKTAELYSL